MSSSVYSRTSSSTHAQPCLNQNTASIQLYTCLYTRDLRRKSKRWQDGLLRFHTFNRRVMIYDLQQNFIGDIHWREGTEPTDGDEFELERGGVIVQVAERTGESVQDLTGLWEGRNKARQEKASQATPAGVARQQNVISQRAVLQRIIPKSVTPTLSGSMSNRPLAPVHGQTLNALLGTPRGPQGKAVLPTTSPYDQRRDHEEQGRRKRSRNDNSASGCQATPIRQVSRPNVRPPAVAARIPSHGPRVSPPRDEPIEIYDSDDHAILPVPQRQSRIRKMKRRDQPTVDSSALAHSETDPQIRRSVSRSSTPPLNPLRLPSRRPQKVLYCQANTLERQFRRRGVEHNTEAYRSAQAARVQARLSSARPGRSEEEEDDEWNVHHEAEAAGVLEERPSTETTSVGFDTPRAQAVIVDPLSKSVQSQTTHISHDDDPEPSLFCTPPTVNTTEQALIIEQRASSTSPSPVLSSTKSRSRPSPQAIFPPLIPPPLPPRPRQIPKLEPSHPPAPPMTPFIITQSRGLQRPQSRRPPAPDRIQAPPPKRTSKPPYPALPPLPSTQPHSLSPIPPTQPDGLPSKPPIEDPSEILGPWSKEAEYLFDWRPPGYKSALP